MNQKIPYIVAPDPQNEVFFPPISDATEDGIVMLGGRMEPTWLVAAYSRGIFPWPMEGLPDHLIPWCSPDPRAIIEFDEFHISRSLNRVLRKEQFKVTCDLAFEAVIKGCQAPRGKETGTWITPSMVAAYMELHQMGIVHSIEVWDDQSLVGGIYGVAIGGYFSAESMFYTSPNASKVALAYLVTHLQRRGFALFDVQQWSEHTGRFGAKEIPRDKFLQRVETATTIKASFGNELDCTF